MKHRVTTGRIWVVIGLVAGALAIIVADARSGAAGTAARAQSLPAAAGGRAETIWVDVDPRLAEREPLRVAAPQRAGECLVPNVARFESANWECPGFPGCSSAKWGTFDALATAPGLTDEIQWGRAQGESTVGNTSDVPGDYAAWSVGGGSLGRTLSAANKDYPGVGGVGCRKQGTDCGIHTALQFNSFEATNVVGGIRIVFDYKAKLPTNARFFIGVGDFSKRDLSTGRVPLVKVFEAELQRDTGGEWVRGVTLPFPEAATIPELLITFEYINNPATTDGYGVFVDNIHLDALFAANPPPCPSPATPVPTPTDTPIVVTPTKTPIRIPTRTRTPTPRPDGKVARLPYVLRGANPRPANPTVIPTAPTPTNTATYTPEPTETPEPTWTPRATDTPLPTPTSTRTPQPEPDLIIEKVIYKRLPGGFAVQIVDLFNQGDGAQDTYRWLVTGSVKVPPVDCRFSDPNHKIPGGEHFYVLAGTEADKQAAVEPYLGRSMICEDSYIFDQNSDSVLLLTDGRDLKDKYCWYQFGPYECSP